MSFDINWVSFEVMYGTMFSSDASPPAFSACSRQNATTVGSLHFSSLAFLNSAFARTDGMSISVAPCVGSSITRSMAFLMYSSNIGPPLVLRS